jgi:arsenate reductase
MPQRVLFVCVENSCRSQMAEAFARRLGGAAVEAVSAGSRPSGVVNPKAIASLAAVGYDLSTHASKSLDEIPPGPYAAAVTMGCGDACPSVPARIREDWALPDPTHRQPAEFAVVRDAIRDRVADLLERLGVAARA